MNCTLALATIRSLSIPYIHKEETRNFLGLKNKTKKKRKAINGPNRSVSLRIAQRRHLTLPNLGIHSFCRLIHQKPPHPSTAWPESKEGSRPTRPSNHRIPTTPYCPPSADASTASAGLNPEASLCLYIQKQPSGRPARAAVCPIFLCSLVWCSAFCRRCPRARFHHDVRRQVRGFPLCDLHSLLHVNIQLVYPLATHCGASFADGGNERTDTSALRWPFRRV